MNLPVTVMIFLLIGLYMTPIILGNVKDLRHILINLIYLMFAPIGAIGLAILILVGGMYAPFNSLNVAIAFLVLAGGFLATTILYVIFMLALNPREVSQG